LDASVALGWLADDPPVAYALRVQRLMIGGLQPVVPVHWHLEIANALLVAERRKVLHRKRAEILNDIVAFLPFVESDDLLDDVGRVIGIGQRQQLTAYDAAYVALAARRNLSLATQNTAMLSAARSLKIPIVR
jgi:predicted nucleic acid-binding protein